MAYLDKLQLKSLYEHRVKEGELYTPKIIYPRDIINYFILIGNNICTIEQTNSCSIRYCVENPYPIESKEQLEDIITKHRGIFRVTLSRVKADFANEGTTLKVFKAFYKSAMLVEGSNNLVAYHWEFSLKDKINKSMLELQTIFEEEPSEEVSA